MNSKELTGKQVLDIFRRWEIDENTELDVQNSEAMILEMLEKRLRKWLEDDFEKLVNVMYRLDVPEERFHEAMGAGDVPSIAKQLARTILTRELIRLEFKRKYEGGK